jgi:curli biogenesis system outer membrane secretion channel CsgG
MRRRAFLLATAAGWLSPRIALAAKLPRVAIVAQGDGTISPASIERFVVLATAALLATGHFTVVDRQRLQAVIKEQGLSNSAYADPATAAALGKIAGASRLLNVDLGVDTTSLSGPFVTYHKCEVSAAYTLVGVDTATVLAAGNVSGVGDRKVSSAAVTEISPAQLEREALEACATDLASELDNRG